MRIMLSTSFENCAKTVIPSVRTRNADESRNIILSEINMQMYHIVADFLLAHYSINKSKDKPEFSLGFSSDIRAEEDVEETSHTISFEIVDKNPSNFTKKFLEKKLNIFLKDLTKYMPEDGIYSLQRDDSGNRLLCYHENAMYAALQNIAAKKFSGDNNARSRLNLIAQLCERLFHEQSFVAAHKLH